MGIRMDEDNLKYRLEVLLNEIKVARGAVNSYSESESVDMESEYSQYDEEASALKKLLDAMDVFQDELENVQEFYE